MRKICLLITALATALVVSAEEPAAQSEIFGVMMKPLFDPTGPPAVRGYIAKSLMEDGAGAQVLLLDEESDAVFHTVADEGGVFRLAPPAGRYRLLILVDGCRPHLKRVDLGPERMRGYARREREP